MASHLQRYAKKTHHSEGVAHSFLSLFLLVLSFFVVLTVLSEPVDKRVQQALSSVAEVFSPVTTYSKVRFNPLSLRASGLSKDDVFEKIETLVETDVRIAKAKRIDKRGVLEVRFANKELFKENSAVIRPNMHVFVRRLVATLDYQSRAVHVSFLTSPDSNDAYIFAPPLDVRRANALAVLALTEGFPASNLQSGLDPQLSNETVFRFQIGTNSFPAIHYFPREGTGGSSRAGRAFEGTSIESGRAREDLSP